MIGLLRFILFCVFVYLIFKLLKLVVLKYISGQAGSVRHENDHPAGRPRVDKSKAQDAEFEEIKNK
jgi:hypothetical protein